jgi:hypothetical protein
MVRHFKFVFIVHVDLLFNFLPESPEHVQLIDIRYLWYSFPFQSMQVKVSGNKFVLFYSQKLKKERQ